MMTETPTTPPQPTRRVHSPMQDALVDRVLREPGHPIAYYGQQMVDEDDRLLVYAAARRALRAGRLRKTRGPRNKVLLWPPPDPPQVN